MGHRGVTPPTADEVYGILSPAHPLNGGAGFDEDGKEAAGPPRSSSEETLEPEAGDSSGLSTRCSGSGMLECNCMGDGCCCGFHGSTECYGCPDCEWDDDDPDAYHDPEND